MGNTISDRVGLLINTLGYNKRTFSQAIGLSNDVTIGRIINEQREPSYKILNSIIQTFGNVNAKWLLTGQGEIFCEKNVHINVHPNVHPEVEENAHLNAYLNAYLIEENGNPEGEKQYTPKYTPEYTPIQVESSKTSSFAVPFYDIPVSAGPLGVLTYSEGAVKPDGYIDMEIFRRCDAILPVIGVSMEPEIHSGDLVGIRKLDSYNWEYLETGKVYMIVTTEDRMIKYINRADDSDYIICSSPNYHDFKIRKADVLEIYRVIANIRVL